jgi:SAM-dependent methyltransferase
MPQPSAYDRFFALLRAAVHEGTWIKLTLGKYRGADPSLKNVFVRPVTLKSGPHCAFVWRHATRDVTKNYAAAEALEVIESLAGREFLDAHLFTTTVNAQFESSPTGTARLRITPVRAEGGPSGPKAPRVHDRAKTHLVSATAPWLRALGVTNDRGQPREGMADKFRQIQKFTELLSHLLDDAFPATTSPDHPATVGPASADALRVADMGSGKGYLTFALSELLGARAMVQGIEARQELVDLCNRVARESGLAPRLNFTAGAIADIPLDACDVLLALHACDTATDDALARGIKAGATLLVVAPCCQKELRSQLAAPPVLAEALRHGIFRERQAEFVTDALRSQLLECAGYRTKVFEFISTEHTAKNLMIAGIKTGPRGGTTDGMAQRTRDFAAFYGIKRQRLATLLDFAL